MRELQNPDLRFGSSNSPKVENGEDLALDGSGKASMEKRLQQVVQLLCTANQAEKKTIKATVLVSSTDLFFGLRDSGKRDEGRGKGIRAATEITTHPMVCVLSQSVLIMQSKFPERLGC